jgi:hypothetical protein
LDYINVPPPVCACVCMHKSSSSGCHSHTKRKKRRVAHQPKLCPTESKSCEFGKDSFGVFISFWLTNHRSYPPRLELVKPWNRIKYLLPQQTLSSCTSYGRRKKKRKKSGPRKRTQGVQSSIDRMDGGAERRSGARRNLSARRLG